jgi:protein O-mannosyl-transferase
MKKTGTYQYFVGGLVSLITFLVYLPALHNEFVNWDDGIYVYENPYIQKVNMNFVQWAFFDFHAGNWHPLTWISHALDYAIWGLNPFGHHLTNNIIHSLNALVVVLLGVKLVELFHKRSNREKTSFFPSNENSPLIVGTVAGMLFGIHPLHVESVAWIAERKDVLCALFFLLSIRSYINFVDSGIANSPFKRMTSRFFNKRYLYALGFFILALLSKPMAVTLPVVLIIIDWFPCERIRSREAFKDSLTEKIPFLILSLVSSVMTVLAQSSDKALVPFEANSLILRLIISARALLSYLSKMFFPFDLIPFYPYPKGVSFLSLKYLMPVLLVVACTAACIAASKKWKLWLAVWSYYVITLLPVLGIIQVGGQSMADRYTYLPSIGPFIALGLGAALLFEKANSLKPRNLPVKATFFIVGSMITLFLSFESIKQIHVWKNSITLWNYVIKKEPGEMTPAYYNLGLFYGQKGSLDMAIQNFSRAIEINPKFDMAFNNRGTTFYLQGQYERAFDDFNQAINLSQNNAEAYTNRGYVYLERGDKALAIPDLQRACSLGNEPGCAALQHLSK